MTDDPPEEDLLRSAGPFGYALDLTRSAMNCQRNRPATNAAIFDQRLFGLGCVDLQREGFTAVRTNNVCFVNQLHFPSSQRRGPNLDRGVGLFRGARVFRIAQLAEMQLTDPPAIRL
jgi:hypothetical protein